VKALGGPGTNILGSNADDDAPLIALNFAGCMQDLAALALGASGQTILEYRIPAEHLPDLTANVIGPIEVMDGPSDRRTLIAAALASMAVLNNAVRAARATTARASRTTGLALRVSMPRPELCGTTLTWSLFRSAVPRTWPTCAKRPQVRGSGHGTSGTAGDR
jgi:hypothetical protein